MAKVLYLAKRRLPRDRVYTIGAARIRRAYIAIWVQRIQHKAKGRHCGVVVVPIEPQSKQERGSPDLLMWYDEAASVSPEQAARIWASITPRCLTWVTHGDPTPRPGHYQSPIDKED